MKTYFKTYRVGASGLLRHIIASPLKKNTFGCSAVREKATASKFDVATKKKRKKTRALFVHVMLKKEGSAHPI